MRNCINCGEETANPKFCSRSCAASFNNKAHPKRKSALLQCRVCRQYYPTVAFARRQLCSVCYSEVLQRKEDRSNATIGELADKYEAAQIHRSWWYSEVRTMARNSNAHREKRCQVCGYSKHVEYCHIVAIKDFQRDAKLSSINAPSNIAILCRNCHWEFDNGLLDL